ncbi:NACHT domain-containing protein [Leptolyngbya sp. CCY15150]|uniref:NACHT domain-containing protein n=1 Tax=Leptolyngbya sp. CCY15150 TaxID=2767772 RepID=UPI0019512D6C|nr:NACHT domain-containing protein [Leptolyngbya sp. CCY15150]
MLEWLAVPAIEVGKWAFAELGKPALESYVQDFFKACLSGGVSRLKAAELKAPMNEAIGYFIKRFIKELQLNDVPDTSIHHHYRATIKTFVQDPAVRPILGKAFEKDCKKIDDAQLEQIWAQQDQGSGWQFPSEEFDWRGVCKEYMYEVKGIVKASPELRDILNSDLLEDIARNTAQRSPGFDIETYRASLQASYGYLKLYTLDSTDRVDAIKLWAMFIEQTVREALPPMRYDLPLDLRQKSEFSENSDFLTQPAQKVLEAVADSQRAVILGDPGAGKSSLLHYLALEWVEGKTEKLPLLIELREFALNPSTDFLEFLHSGRGVDWQFDQHQLHQHLLENPTLVMFNGLDEVFDRTSQATVIDDIIRFSQQYPNAQVLVTSRIIGYNPDRLRHSEFRHFTIQSLDTDEVHKFIDRWYDLSMGSDPDKVRLKQRLKDAIANSRAIANLADNPLLLTMMAILNRRQELPRDRADLYDQASRVLLYHWDVDHKRLPIPMDAIGRREKQEMLRLIAYEMQAGEDGLRGNLISADRLTRILTDYLRDQGFSEPREKANRLIQQLRDRNFILCDRGADTYGFMHRTFLEYFCAVEIVHRFEKQGILTFEQLRDKFFGQHWQDESWDEPLRLVCSIIDPNSSKQLIEFLLTQKPERIQASEVKVHDLRYLTLACDCLSEVSKNTELKELRQDLLQRMKSAILKPYAPLSQDAAEAVLHRIGKNYSDSLSWLKELLDWTEVVSLEEEYPQKNDLFKEIYGQKLCYVPMSAILTISKNFYSDPGTLEWLKSQVNSDYPLVPQTVISEVAHRFHDHPDTIDWLKKHAQDSEDTLQVSYHVIAKYYRDNPDTLFWFQRNLEDEWIEAQCRALEVMGKFYSNTPEIFSIIRGQFYKHQQSECFEAFMKSVVVQTIAESFPTHPETFRFMCEVVQEKIPVPQTDEMDRYYRGLILLTAIETLITHYPMNLQTTERLLHDRALNDPDEQLREWAQEQLVKWKNRKDSDTIQ